MFSVPSVIYDHENNVRYCSLFTNKEDCLIMLKDRNTKSLQEFYYLYCPLMKQQPNNNQPTKNHQNL